MKLVKDFIWSVIFSSFGFFMAGTTDSSELIEIVQEILKSESINRVTCVTVLTPGNDSITLESEDFLEKLIKVLSDSRTVLLVNENSMKQLSKKKVPLSLIYLNSIEDFKRIVVNFSASRFHYGGFYIILFQNGTEEEVAEIFWILWELYIHNINLIRSDNKTILVETFIPFSPQKCNCTDVTRVAEYENEEFNRKPSDFFPKKFLNFYNCSLNLVTFASLAPSVLKRNFINGSFELYGRDIEVMKMLKTELNFYPNITYLHEYGSWGALYSNGTTTGAMGRAARRETDLTWGNLNLKRDRTLIMDFSFGYYLETLIFVIPRGEPYNPFIKLLRPFSKFVWIALTGVVILCILVILFLSFQPRKVRDFVYGERINGPFMNVLIAVYGGSQNTLPAFNFARSILMMFLLFCLVFRSVYQGSLYQFLQSNDNKPELSSIEEMSEHDFRFFMITSYDDMTRDNAAMMDKRVIIDPSELQAIMDSTINTNFKGTLLVALSEILYKNKKKAQDLEQLYTVCKVNCFSTKLFMNLT